MELFLNHRPILCLVKILHYPMLMLIVKTFPRRGIRWWEMWQYKGCWLKEKATVLVLAPSWLSLVVLWPSLGSQFASARASISNCQERNWRWIWQRQRRSSRKLYSRSITQGRTELKKHKWSDIRLSCGKRSKTKKNAWSRKWGRSTRTAATLNQLMRPTQCSSLSFPKLLSRGLVDLVRWSFLKVPIHLN